MTVELQLTVLSYDAETERSAVLRRDLPVHANIARAGDHVVANENWPPIVVERVTWDEDLRNAVVVLGAIDADEVGPTTVALDVLQGAGWQLLDIDDTAELDSAAASPGLE